MPGRNHIKVPLRGAERCFDRKGVLLVSGDGMEEGCAGCVLEGARFSCLPMANRKVALGFHSGSDMMSAHPEAAIA